MESRPASPGSVSTASMARLDDSSSSSSSQCSKDSRLEPSHSSSPGLQQPEAVFESRGSLDTLAAAALKPLPEKYGQRHRLPQPQLDQEQEQEQEHQQQHQQQQQQQQNQIQQKQHSRLSSHAAHSHGSLESVSGSVRPSPSHDHNSRNSSTSSLPHPTPHSEERSSRFHYRDQRQHVSDEDSEDDPLYRSRQDPRKEQEQHSSLTLRPSPDNSQTGKPNGRSTMSISSLLGDSTAPGFPRKQMNETQTQTQTRAHTLPHSSPERHASQQLVPHRHNDTEQGDQADRHFEVNKEARDTLVRPQSDNARDHRLAQERQDPNLHQHHHHHGHTHNLPHRHHRHMHHREDSGLALPGIENSAPQHHHGAHHHHHHQRAHPHVHHHHHPQHTHQHPHPHAQVPHHHHHHHAHHHHMHQGKSLSSSKSAFAYMPRSIGLSLNPRLKVNATQVYISYLIQLDQMQRAQHLMRSSEKRKSVQDASSSLKDRSEYTNQSAGHARTSSTGDATRGSQVDRYQEEKAAASHEGRAASPPSDTEERKRRFSYNSGATGSGSLEIAQPPAETIVDTTERTSSLVSRVGEHTHHRHQHGHMHVHQHTAPVFPAHIHPAQHHHHVVPSSVTKAEKSLVVSSKSNGSQSVHRHHTLHHHHPHHHPYHPNHPNHQHHFHHHTHPAGHNHNHTHNHGHNHVHVHGHAHAHTHGHGHGHGHGPGHAHLHHHSHTPSPGHTGHASSRTHSHRHSKSPSYQKSPSLERVQQQKREQQTTDQARRRSQILALPAPQPQPSPCTNGSPSQGGFAAGPDTNGFHRSSSPSSQRQDRHSSSPAHGNTDEVRTAAVDEEQPQSHQDRERSMQLSPSPPSARTENAMHLD